MSPKEIMYLYYENRLKKNHSITLKHYFGNKDYDMQ